MTYLNSIHLEGQALKALMKERKELIQVSKNTTIISFVFYLKKPVPFFRK